MDEACRGLQRSFESSGSREDEVAWLRALLRGGALGEERLKLAAWLGHEACLEITGLPRLDAANERARFDLAIGYGLEDGSDATLSLEHVPEESLRPAVALRCAAAVGREFLREYEQKQAGPRTIRAMLGALDAMALCGRARTVEAFEKESAPREERGREALIRAWLHPQKRTGTGVLDGLYASIVGFALSGNGCTFGMLGLSNGSPVHLDRETFGLRRAELKGADALRPWQAVTRELLPWLLGRSDPVLERFLARSATPAAGSPGACAVEAEVLRLGAGHGSAKWEPGRLRGASPSEVVLEPLPAPPSPGEALALAFRLEGFPRQLCVIARVTPRLVEERTVHEVLWLEPAAGRFLAMWSQKAKAKKRGG